MPELGAVAKDDGLMGKLLPVADVRQGLEDLNRKELAILRLASTSIMLRKLCNRA